LVLINAFVPGAAPQAIDVVLEYLARRFFASLAMSWSGPESSVVQFDSQAGSHPIEVAGVVKLSASVNGETVSIWLSLGKALVERLDGLWRRQIQSTGKVQEGASVLNIEVSQLAVPPTMLVEYLKSGTVVDLEVAIGDSVTLRAGNKAWQSARLCDVDGKVGFEVLPGPAPAAALPDGTTRLSIQFGSLHLEPSAFAELGQPGAIVLTQIPLSDTVQLVINGEKVGTANLCCYQGRFAITVI
jgi:flagellar motor switch/type III secretory pathway protein FliN